MLDNLSPQISLNRLSQQICPCIKITGSHLPWAERWEESSGRAGFSGSQADVGVDNYPWRQREKEAKGTPNSSPLVRCEGGGKACRPENGGWNACVPAMREVRQKTQKEVCNKNRRARKKERPDVFPRALGNGRAKTGGGPSKETGIKD